MKNISIILLLFIIHSFVCAQPKEVKFTRDYITRYDNKVNIEVHEVQELTYVMMAISEVGLRDSNMVNHNSSYYQEVIRHFKPFQKHPAVQIIDSLLKESIIYYIFLSSNAYGFQFKGDQLLRTHVYSFPARGVGAIDISEDPIAKYLKEIEDFAKVSNFRKFYKEQFPTYKQVIADYEKYGELDKQKEWLESKFEYKINSYRVLTSPLIGGINATRTFTDNNFKEMLLYLPTIKQDTSWTEEYNVAMNSRVIFTEIDHNYVGPLSDQFKNRIDQVFDKREIWVDANNKSTQHYPNPIKVFDEYLTWGLFILYIHDIFPNNDSLLNQVIEHVNDKMIIKGFPKSKEFNDVLLNIYKNNPQLTLKDIYPELLNWGKKLENNL